MSTRSEQEREDKKNEEAEMYHSQSVDEETNSIVRDGRMNDHRFHTALDVGTGQENEGDSSCSSEECRRSTDTHLKKGTSVISTDRHSKTTTAEPTSETATRKATKRKTSRWAPQFQAFVHSLLTINWCELALVPAFRTSIVIVLEWIIFGVGTADSTAFQLGALFTGLTDPNGNLTKRLYGMGSTLLVVVLMGTLLPSLLFDSLVGSILAAFGVAFLTGCSPLWADPAVMLSLKLGTALFAIQSGVLRTRDGGTGDAVLWTLFGSSCSLLVAILPELIGNRDAIRTDLFKVWHGFGCFLGKWSSQWGTYGHTGRAPVPHVTLSICKITNLLHNDQTEEEVAKTWLLGLVERLDTIRTASLCLSNGYEMVRRDWTHEKVKTVTKSGQDYAVQRHDRKIDELFRSMAILINEIGFAFQFPWFLRFFPLIRLRIKQMQKKFHNAVQNVLDNNDDNSLVQVRKLSWLEPLVQLLQSELDASVQQILEFRSWPHFSPMTSIPKRVLSAIPTKFPVVKKDPDWAMRGYALRFASAYTLGTVTEILMRRTASAHWFPMTIAFIMGPSEASTYEKVTHRTIGTLAGIVLGTAIIPLFDFPIAHIILLGLNTFGACLFFTANYAIFTFFITSWVFCTTIGVGAPTGRTILYRCMWTLAAAFVVTVVTYFHPPRNDAQLTKLLAEFAKSVRSFAEAVVERHSLSSKTTNRIESDHQDENLVALDDASQRVKQAKKEATEKRLAVFTYIHDAVLTPTKGCRIDPNTVAPLLASDLVDAVVIPGFLSLVENGCDGLWSELSNLSELERLVKRLENECETCHEVSVDDETLLDSDLSTITTGGPFSRAVATAHKRLDKVGVESCTSSNSRIISTSSQ